MSLQWAVTLPEPRPAFPGQFPLAKTHSDLKQQSGKETVTNSMAPEGDEHPKMPEMGGFFLFCIEMRFGNI